MNRTHKTDSFFLSKSSVLHSHAGFLNLVVKPQQICLYFALFPSDGGGTGLQFFSLWLLSCRRAIMWPHSSGFQSEVWPWPISRGCGCRQQPLPLLLPMHTPVAIVARGRRWKRGRQTPSRTPPVPLNKGGGGSASHLPPPTGLLPHRGLQWKVSNQLGSNLRTLKRKICLSHSACWWWHFAFLQQV